LVTAAYDFQAAVDAGSHIIVPHEVINLSNGTSLANKRHQSRMATARHAHVLADRGHLSGFGSGVQTAGIVPIPPRPLTSPPKVDGAELAGAIEFARKRSLVSLSSTGEARHIPIDVGGFGDSTGQPYADHGQSMTRKEMCPLTRNLPSQVRTYRDLSKPSDGPFARSAKFLTPTFAHE
jgi:hypothetical protein